MIKTRFNRSNMIMLASLALCLSVQAPGKSGGNGSNPLFIQVHITNTVSDISSAELAGVLSGRIANFKEIGGPDSPIRVFAHPGISSILQKAHPMLQFTTGDFEDAPVLSDRAFLGISDARGLSPCFKTVYIDRTLPWGRILDDSSLDGNARYPFVADGAEAWDPLLHLSVVQTGVTAMTRAFIPWVERSGDMLSPVKFTKAITSQADLAITSNEVSFADPCGYPLKNNMLFCSPLRYFEILTQSGFDMIELTGNHNNDFGPAYNSRSIALLELAGMNYFGGGKNKSDAEKVRYLTVKGTVMAFVGFNECGPDIAWATETRPGAARFSKELFNRAISEAVRKADVVFVTVQWCNENDPVPQEIQKKFFHAAADMGAAIIVSSSAHRPMGLETYRGRLISYGLGNFLFDQMQSLNHRRGLIARHHIYRKRHVATEFIPYIIHNYSQPRIVSGREARELMEEIFRYSIGPAFRRASSSPERLFRNHDIRLRRKKAVSKTKGKRP